jgi:hypothetical protein
MNPLRHSRNRNQKKHVAPMNGAERAHLLDVPVFDSNHVSHLLNHTCRVAMRPRDLFSDWTHCVVGRKGLDGFKYIHNTCICMCVNVSLICISPRDENSSAAEIAFLWQIALILWSCTTLLRSRNCLLSHIL